MRPAVSRADPTSTPRFMKDRMTTKSIVRLLILAIALTGVPAVATAGVLLKLGDILVAEPGADSISVVDASTGAKTIISQGGLLSPAHKTVGVALARDGDVIVVHRQAGLIRINPATGDQSIHSQGGLFRDPWAIAIDRVTGDIYVADSGYDNDRPEINEAGKIIRVHPTSGAQELIATGQPVQRLSVERRVPEHDVGRLVPGSSLWHCDRRHRAIPRRSSWRTWARSTARARSSASSRLWAGRRPSCGGRPRRRRRHRSRNRLHSDVPWASRSSPTAIS